MEEICWTENLYFWILLEMEYTNQSHNNYSIMPIIIGVNALSEKVNKFKMQMQTIIPVCNLHSINDVM